MQGDEIRDVENRTFVEGVDFYFDDGLMVMTRKYLIDRGYCCENRCRHCPYGLTTDPVLEQIDL